jgi:hypothetical protein
MRSKGWAFALGAAAGFALIGVAAPMVRFLLDAWTHAGF